MNDLPWTKDTYNQYLLENATSFKNNQLITEKILNCDTIKRFNHILSLENLMFYAYNSIVKYANLYKKVNEIEVIDVHLKQKFQSEANFLIFAFLQTITPFRDIVTDNNFMTIENIRLQFSTGEFDFFTSLRNLLTHKTIPVVGWTEHIDLVRKTKNINIPIADRFLRVIELDMQTENRNRFRYSGYDFILSKKNISFGILMTQFWKKMHKNIFQCIMDDFLLLHGEELDLCNYYLEKHNEFASAELKYALRKAIPTISLDKEKKRERFYHVLLLLGGAPEFYDLDLEAIVLDTSFYD